MGTTNGRPCSGCTRLTTASHLTYLQDHFATNTAAEQERGMVGPSAPLQSEGTCLPPPVKHIIPSVTTSWVQFVGATIWHGIQTMWIRHKHSETLICFQTSPSFVLIELMVQKVFAGGVRSNTLIYLWWQCSAGKEYPWWWGGVSSNHWTPLVVVTGTQTGLRYVNEILYPASDTTTFHPSIAHCGTSRQVGEHLQVLTLEAEIIFCAFNSTAASLFSWTGESRSQQIIPKIEKKFKGNRVDRYAEIEDGIVEHVPFKDKWSK